MCQYIIIMIDSLQLMTMHYSLLVDYPMFFLLPHPRLLAVCVWWSVCTVECVYSGVCVQWSV